MSIPWRTFFLAAVACTILDQASKLAIDAWLARGHVYPLIAGFFELSNVRNPGASFGLFVIRDPSMRLLVMGGSTLVAMAFVVYLFLRLGASSRGDALALGAILGGATGNLIDRLVHGAVVDFLRVHLGPGYTWPDFNLADSAIVCGVAFLLAETVLRRSEPSTEVGDA